MSSTLRTLAAALALAAVSVVAAPASALTITLTNSDLPLPVGQTMIEDFDNPIATGFSFTQNANAFVRDGSLGLWPGVSAPPPGDNTFYETVTSGGRATLQSNRGLKAFSFFTGSPDSYNTVRFTGLNGYQQTLAGGAIFGGAVLTDGNQSVGRRVNYDFGAQRVTKIEFLSSGNSFEFDSLAASAAPEPATWGMMILGFGAVGALVRRRKALLA